MSKTKCFFKSVPETLKATFSQSRCLFTISVGQQTHESDYFDATIDLIGKTFKSCTMLVDDSLQRHTMALDRKESPDYFYEISIKEGNLWMARNKKYYEKLNNLEKIVRWDTWLNHPQFDHQKKSIQGLMNHDKEYESAFEHSVNEFVTKYQNRMEDASHFDVNRAKKLSFDFILEECTALCLWVELNCHYEAYPHAHNAAITETRKRFVLPHYPNLLHSLTLGFRNAKPLSAQRFICLEDKKD